MLGKWKAKSCFISGYLAHLEKLFAASMPEAELKVPNIDSGLGYLRKNFNALQDIKQKDSGFEWDDNQKMVTGDRKLFDDWAKVISQPLFFLHIIFASNKLVVLHHNL